MTNGARDRRWTKKRTHGATATFDVETIRKNTTELISRIQGGLAVLLDPLASDVTMLVDELDRLQRIEAAARELMRCIDTSPYGDEELNATNALRAALAEKG